MVLLDAVEVVESAVVSVLDDEAKVGTVVEVTAVVDVVAAVVAVVGAGDVEVAGADSTAEVDSSG